MADVILSVTVKDADVARVKAAVQTFYGGEYTNAELKAKIEEKFWNELQNIVASVESNAAGAAASADVYENLLPG